MERPVIGRLDVGEIPEMQRLRREALATEPLAFLATPEDDLALDAGFVARSIADPKASAIFVARGEGALVGMLGIVRETRVKSRHRAQVWGMFVAPGARGRGLGAGILGAALGHARGWEGVVQVHLSVSVRTPLARRLYERAGFVAWGREPRSISWEGEFFDEEYMVLDLRRKA